MSTLFTKEQARAWVRENNLKDVKGIEDAFTAQIKDVLQEVLEEEMNSELGYSKYDWKTKQTDNSRNGHTKKTVKGKFGEIDLKIPRDTKGEFEPTIVRKHERTIASSVEDMIRSMYAKGMTTRDIHDHMQQIYGIEVSAEMVSRITDKVMSIAREWQNRPLDGFYPILYLDGMMFNVMQDSQITKKTVYVITAITVEGTRDVLGIWIGEAESAKFWMKVLVDIRNRGVIDILIASVDGLKGFEEAISSVFPNTEVQKCVVHQIRNSTRFVPWKDRKQFCADMRTVYTAPNEEAGLDALDAFEQKWGAKYPHSIKSWRANWNGLATMYKYPDTIRKIIYTTNPIEGFNRIIRKSTKTRGSFPTDDSLFKLLYLIVMDQQRKGLRARKDWTEIINQLSIYFGERVTKHMGG